MNIQTFTFTNWYCTDYGDDWPSAMRFNSRYGIEDFDRHEFALIFTDSGAER
jgi:hypothetical protein